MNNLKLIKSEREKILEDKKQSDWLSALFEINRLLCSCSSLDEVYDKVIEVVTSLLEVESAGIILFSKDSNELILQRAAFALSREDLAAYRLPLTSSGKTINVFQTGQPYVSENCNQDASTFRKYANVYGVRNTAMVPLEVENRRIGVLHVYNKKAGPFTHEDEEILLVLAAHLAVLIENVNLYDREKKMVETLDKLNQKTLAHQARLEKLLEIHNQLIGKVLNGEGLPSIIQAISAVLKAPVIIEDKHCRLLGASEDIDGSKYSLKCLPGKKSWDRSLQSGQIVRCFPYNYQGVECTRVIAPIGDSSHLIGYFSVIMDPDRAEIDLENVAIEQGAIVLALEMMKEKIKTEVEARYRGEFLDDLLNGAYGSDESFFQRAEFFSYNLNFPIRVVVVSFKKKGKSILSAEIHGHFIKSAFEELFPRCFTARKENNLVVFLPVASGQDSRELTAGFKRVNEKITQQYPDFNMIVGIGNMCWELRDFQESYQQALKALTFSRPEVITGAQLIFYEELGFLGLLAEIKDQNVLAKFVNSKIGPLLTYDPKKSQAFIETLEEYIKSGNSLRDTAQTLHIHIGTLKYRLRRIREILDDLEFNAESLFDLRVALFAYRLLSK